jgi:transcription antitermination factor NusG
VATEIQERWYILVTEPQREVTATAGLIARKFVAFCPMVYRAQAVKDRNQRQLKDENGKKVWKKISEPMFRGYAFIRFTTGNEAFMAAKAVPGVSGYVKTPDGRGELSPASIPGALMDAIRRQEEDKLSAYEQAQRTGSDKLKIPFVEGGLAKIDSGPYDDWIGKMKKLNKNGRIRMLLSGLGGEIEVEVDGSQVRAA